MILLGSKNKKNKTKYNKYSNHIKRGEGIHVDITQLDYAQKFLQEFDGKFIPGGCQFNAMRVFNVYNNI